jgi:hypothetical protein
LHKEVFTHSKFLHREAATQDAPKLRNICCQSTIRNLHAATTLDYLRVSAAKDIKSILHAAAAARNLDAAIPRRAAETELQSTKNYAQQLHKLQLQNWISTPTQINDDFEALFKRNFKRKLSNTKIKKKMLPKYHSPLSCTYCNAIYDSQLQNTIEVEFGVLYPEELADY